MDTIAHIVELGVLFLMFIAGIDLHLSVLAKSGKVSALAGTFGVLLPLGMGYGVARAFSFDAQALAKAARNIVGDLEKPDSGLLFIAPLVEVYGLNKDTG